MRATRVLMLSALCGWMLTGWPVATDAQVYDAARQSLDFSPDPTARSPRLLGMGRLTLASDVHNGIDLWDFAGNPIGIFENARPGLVAQAFGGTSRGRGRRS